MKLTHITGLIMALILAPFAALARAFGPTPDLVASNSAGSHYGPVTRFAETAFGAPHLVAGKGTTAGKQVAPCAATGVLPIGFARDEAAVGEAVAVETGYGNPGLGVASAAIAADVPVYTAAGGKLSSTGGAGKYLMGRSLSAAGGDGDEFELQPCPPVLQA
jgi:hypothetical protein